MALNLDVQGQKIGPIIREYTWKDPILYALGVGAGFSELEYCYEKNLKVIPTFPMAAIMDFFWQVGTIANVKPAGVLHGEQELIFHNPIPIQGQLSTVGHIKNFYDKGKDKGALVVAESETSHSNGDLLVTSIITIFARLDGGFGGENILPKKIFFPDHPPDIVVKDTPSENQPLLYRLTGDLFPLHVDPEFSKVAGFDKPIMHGLCTYGFACRALVDNLVPSEPERVRRIDCRFSKPLYPGVSIETLIWKTAPNEAVWKTVNAETGQVVINNGVFKYEKINPHI